MWEITFPRSLQAIGTFLLLLLIHIRSRAVLIHLKIASCPELPFLQGKESHAWMAASTPAFVDLGRKTL
jgi:hypothetical protein